MEPKRKTGWLVFVDGYGEMAGQKLPRLVFEKKKGKESDPTKFDHETQLHPDLRTPVEGRVPVDFDFLPDASGGTRVNVRPAGKDWTAPKATPSTPRSESGASSSERTDRQLPQHAARRQRQGVCSETAISPTAPSHDNTQGGRFHNPYTFIPAPPRNTNHPNLGDAHPAKDGGHARYQADRWSGRLRVTMRVETPVLVPDTPPEEDRNGHKTFDMRVGLDGKTPLIPPTFVKGMLRAAYEAVTNSRMGVFAGHDARLGWRMEAKGGLELWPARIEGGKVRLLGGTSQEITERPPTHPQPAAWLPRYNKNAVLRPVPNIGVARQPFAREALKYADGTLPQHGHAVICTLRKYRFERYNRKNDTHSYVCDYWKVESVARPSDPPPHLGSPARPTKSASNFHEPLVGSDNTRTNIHGWVCITNPNIGNKHDERVFFTAPGCPSNALDLTEQTRTHWRTLLLDYRAQHEKDIEKRRKAIADHHGRAAATRETACLDWKSPDINKTAFSRHLYDDDALNLRDGTLCYAKLRKKGKGGLEVGALYPVQISRVLHDVAPETLLPACRKPARDLKELSPADRVFGWANQSGSGAWRGQLRVGTITCTSPDPVDSFDASGSIPLAILGQPKPHQTRFYAAQTPEGSPLRDGVDKKDTVYSKGMGLRGFKVYPHHANLPNGYWSDPEAHVGEQAASIPDDGRYREYLRPAMPETERKDGRDEARDDQNRSVRAWIKPGARFEFDIHVTNLSEVELGALVWLLDLPEDHFHRLGGGKPLGFGSVRLEIASAALFSGRDARAAYRALSSPQGTDAPINVARSAFEASIRGAARDCLTAFTAAARGLGTSKEPVHYPRTSRAPLTNAENFKWFQENERVDKQALPALSGSTAALPDLIRLRNHKKR